MITGVKLRAREKEPNVVWQADKLTEMTENSERFLRPFIQVGSAADEITVVSGIWAPMTSVRTCAPVASCGSKDVAGEIKDVLII